MLLRPLTSHFFAENGGPLFAGQRAARNTLKRKPPQKKSHRSGSPLEGDVPPSSTSGIACRCIFPFLLLGQGVCTQGATWPPFVWAVLLPASQQAPVFCALFPVVHPPTHWMDGPPQTALSASETPKLRRGLRHFGGLVLPGLHLKTAPPLDACFLPFGWLAEATSHIRKKKRADTSLKRSDGSLKNL